MKKRLTLTASAMLMLATPLVAENVNGFENFTLSRNDFKSNSSSVLADFSSRTRTEGNAVLSHFSSKEPKGFVLKLR